MRSDNKHCRPLLPSLFSAHHSKIQEVLAPAHQQLSFHPRPPPPSPEPRWREDHEKIRTKSTDSSTLGCGKRLAPWYLWVTALQYLWVRVQYDDLKSLIACTAVLLTGECSSVWWGCPFRGEVCEGKRGAEVSGCVSNKNPHQVLWIVAPYPPINIKICREWSGVQPKTTRCYVLPFMFWFVFSLVSFVLIFS